MMLQFHLH
ncbi:UNVERIFIED_CONTAM: hypothetical protein GTU68_047662 [Idotea baltica]|nr:hypothetical protein [Idotea baltica]